MMMYIVVPGLIVVVILVVVLVALGMRANRAAQDDDDWMADEQPQHQPQPQSRRGRRGAPAAEEQVDDGYGDGYNDGYASDGYAADGYSDSYGSGYDRRVAGAPMGAPLAAPTPAPAPPAPATSRGHATDEMADDDYWATITFDKPKFPWQHDTAKEKTEAEMAADPLAAAEAAAQNAPQGHQSPMDSSPAGMTQPVALNNGAPGGFGAPGGQGTGPQAMPTPPPSFGPGSEQHDMPVGSHFRTDAPGDVMGGNPAGPTRQDPLDFPAPPMQTPPPSDPLGLPVGRTEDHTVGYASPADTSYDVNSSFAVPDSSYNQADTSYGQPDTSYGAPEPSYGAPEPSYGAPEPSYGAPEPSYSDASYGVPDSPYGSESSNGAGHGGGYGDHLGGLAPAAHAAPLSAPIPTPAPHAGAGGPNDTDSHRLPTVDELLQRIQSDRQRSGSGTPGFDSSVGAPLTDPLNDPLSTTSDPSYGSSAPWAASTASGLGHGDELSSGQLSGGFSNLSGTSAGYGSAPSGQGYSTDGYPTQPAYGEAPRYDDPLGGSSTGGGGRDSYGSFGGSGDPGNGRGQAPPPAGEPGRYGDFSGSSYSGDPQPPAGGYADPAATQAYGNATPGYSGYGQQGYGQPGPNDSGAPRTEHGAPYGQGQGEPQRSQDDWESHRDYRR